MPTSTTKRSPKGPGSKAPAAGTRWLVSVFMKPDAALESAAVADIEEIARGTRGAGVKVLVQLERVTDIERLEIEDGRQLLHPSPNPRAASSFASLVEFLRWGKAKVRAERHLVIVWGHSRGVGVDLVGPRAGVALDPLPAPVLPLGAARRTSGTSGPPPGPPPDALRITELARIGRNAGYGAVSGKPAIDVLGLDSCYMSSVEFAHELAGQVGFLVASQSYVRREGWNYQQLLGELSANPRLGPEALADSIVRHVRGLEGDTNLARLDLAKSEAFVGAFGRLVAALTEVVRDPVEARALAIAFKRAAYLQVRQFLDVRDLCHKIAEMFDGDVQVRAREVLAAYEAFVFSRSRGAALGLLNGLSVYYPHVQAGDGLGTLPDVNAVVDAQEYQSLRFVTETGWLTFVDGLTRRLR